MKKCISFIVLFLIISAPALAGNLYSEKHYQEIFCDKKDGVAEVVMEDRTRCDCIFEQDGIEYAVEVDFARKRYQAVGQALHYSRMTGKRAGVLLIIEDPDKDSKYLDSMVKDIEYHNLDINVFTIYPE